MAKRETRQVAVVFPLGYVLEWTFPRGVCLKEQLEKAASMRLHLQGHIDLNVEDIALHSISTTKYEEIKVVFTVTRREK
jgi:hypothetical protein